MPPNRLKRRDMAEIATIIVAAGRGTRMGAGSPKQYRPLGGEPAIRASLKAFAGHSAVRWVQAVIHPDDREHFRSAAAGLSLLDPINGGETRQDSVLAGLEALALRQPDIVLIHDAARPFVSD